MSNTKKSSFYKQTPDLEKTCHLRDPGQMALPRYFRSTVRDNVSAFPFNPPKLKVYSAPAMTSTRAKQIAKEKNDSVPKISWAQLNAELEAEEKLLKEREALEKKMIKQRAKNAEKKKIAKAKVKAKQLEQRGKRPEGQASLVKFGFHSSPSLPKTDLNDEHNTDA